MKAGNERMKIIPSKPTREKESGLFVRDGDFAYKIEHNWAKWPSEAKGSDVLGASCDKDGNLFVSTSHPDYPICVFAPDGTFVRTFAQGLFKRPHGVFITKDNTLLCADTSPSLHTIQEIDMQGNLIRTFGTPGVASDTGYDHFAYKHAQERGEVTPEQEKDPLHDLNLRLGSIKRAGKPFNIPCGMAVALTGEMFAVDGYGNAAVQKFTADGTYLETWGGPGTEIGQFRLPHWIWIDKHDRLWVADRENLRVSVYTTKGEIVAVVQGGFWRIASVWGNERHVFLGELGGGISIIDLEKMETVAQLGFNGFQLFACHGICGDAKGNLFVTSIKGYRFLGNMIRLSPIV
jgi:hypothetical protein